MKGRKIKLFKKIYFSLRPSRRRDAVSGYKRYCMRVRFLLRKVGLFPFPSLWHLGKRGVVFRHLTRNVSKGGNQEVECPKTRFLRFMHFPLTILIKIIKKSSYLYIKFILEVYKYGLKS